MSKALKSLIMQDVVRRLDGVEDAVLVNVVGLDASASYLLRKRLREKSIQLLAVPNQIARKALESSKLAGGFAKLSGPTAIAWGAEDGITLVKEILACTKDDKFKGFEARGVVVGGEALPGEMLAEVSKWPTRKEQIGILAGTMLAPFRQLASALAAPAGALASQIEQKGKDQEEEPAAA